MHSELLQGRSLKQETLKEQGGEMTRGGWAWRSRPVISTLSRLRRQEGSELAVSMGHIASSRSALSTECNFVRKILRCWGRKGRRKRERIGQVRRAEGEKKREEEKNEKRGKGEVERGRRKKGREKADKRWEGRGKRERRRKWTEREEKKGERGKGTRGRLEREYEDRRGKEEGGRKGEREKGGKGREEEEKGMEPQVNK